MQQLFKIEQKTFSFSFRLPLLVAGLPIFVFGIYGLLQLFLALTSLRSGNTLPEGVYLGVVVSTMSVIIGAPMVWCFFIPDKTITFNIEKSTFDMILNYPFGLCRTKAYEINSVNPELTWHRDLEFSQGGYWTLKVTFPDGRSIERVPEAINLSEQKEKAEIWRNEIIALQG